MENKRVVKINIDIKLVLIVIAIGIWVIVLQNAGVLPTKQKVYVAGGYIDADVTNKVDVSGYVDVNIEAINGHHDVFFNNPKNNDYDKYYVLPVAPK